jgi:hypothetical protein
LDNGEKAGLILYMDDFMSEKLLKFLNGSGVEANRIQDTTYYFLKSRYIMLDILNCEPENLIKIREVYFIFSKIFMIEFYRSSNMPAPLLSHPHPHNPTFVPL